MHDIDLAYGVSSSIADPATWDAVQAQLSASTKRGSPHLASDHLLTGRIRDDGASPMSPTHTRKGSRRYRYYVSAQLTQGQAAEAGRITRLPAAEIEDATVAQLSGSRPTPDRACLIASRLHIVVASDPVASATS